MRRCHGDNGKLFYVVHFIEVPFESIDTYVCVPHSWIISRSPSLDKAAVAYPNNEDSLTIRHRVKNEEKHNEEWRFYMAVIGYESDTFEDAERWMEAHNGNKSCEIKSSGEDMRDSQPESILNRKLRSASRPFFSDTKLSKPSVSVKPSVKNPRKPLPRISFRLPLQSKLKKNMGTQRGKLSEIANPVSGGATHLHTVSEHLKRQQSIIVSSNQLIQSAQTGKAAAVDNKTSSEPTFPHQSASRKLSHKNQPSPAGVDDDDHEDDVDDQVESEPVMEETRYPGRTPANSPEQVPQSESANERSTPLVHHKRSLPEPRLQDVPARQLKEADVNQGTQLRQMLSIPITVLRPSCTPNHISQGKYCGPAVLPSTSAGHQTPRLQGTNGGINKKSSPPCSVANPMNPSAQLLHSSLKKKFSSASENPVAKRMRLQNITRNPSAWQGPSSSTAQLHLVGNPIVKPVPRLAQRIQKEASHQPIRANARSDVGVSDLSSPQLGMTASAAQNLSYLVQYSRSLAEQPNIRPYLLIERTHLEQIERLNSQFEQHNVGGSTGRHAHLPDAMNSEFTSQSDPNSFSQTIQLLPQHNNQYGLHTKDNMQEVLRHEFPGGVIDGAHTNSAAITQNFENILQFPTQNSLSRSHYNFENPPRGLDLSGPSLKLNANLQETERQGVIERAPALLQILSQSLSSVQRGYSHQDPRLRARFDHNFVDEANPTMVDTEVQTAPPPGRLDETPSALQPGIGVVYRNPRTKKLVVDQATEMDLAVDADQCEDGAAESDNQSAPQVADSGCQADGNCVEEQSPFQETDFESEVSNHDVVIDRRECEHPCVDTVNENRPASPQMPRMQQRLAVEQEMLNMYGTLFTQMGASFHYTRDLFNHLRNSILKCAEVYESMLEKIEKLNEVEHLPNNETAKAPKENVPEKSTGINSAPKINHPQKNAWVLPPEYDPNNSKWTRKYQKKAPGLIELIPRTNVYVNKKELANCKRESKDCRTLARMLLTEVFSADALGVCSLTGGKAKAFTSMNLDVRPGLDEDARMVLLTFVERYGAKRGWRTDDTLGIISSIRTKILEMRAKYSQTGSG